MASDSQALIVELDEVLRRASRPQLTAILRRVTDLFVNGAGTYSPDQVAVFDEVFGRLVAKVERAALIEFSGRLADIDTPPDGVVNHLARHEDIAISGPILHACGAVADQTLVEVAKDRSFKHLAAIAGRARIGPALADAVVGRCSSETARKLVGNEGASLSESAFVRLISQASNDRELAAAIERRADLPPELQPFLRLALA